MKALGIPWANIQVNKERIFSVTAVGYTTPQVVPQVSVLGPTIFIFINNSAKRTFNPCHFFSGVTNVLAADQTEAPRQTKPSHVKGTFRRAWPNVRSWPPTESTWRKNWVVLENFLSQGPGFIYREHI